MDIQLKNVKHAAFASEETDCFTATVYIDGKKSGEVSNEGYGGSNSYHPHDLYTTLNDYAKTLPKHICLFIDKETGKPAEMDVCPDILIGDIFNDYIAERDLKKLLGKHIAFVKVNVKGVYQTKVLPKATIDRLLADSVYLAKQQTEGYQILNLMPFADALSVYRTGAQ